MCVDDYLTVVHARLSESHFIAAPNMEPKEWGLIEHVGDRAAVSDVVDVGLHPGGDVAPEVLRHNLLQVESQVVVYSLDLRREGVVLSFARSPCCSRGDSPQNLP